MLRRIAILGFIFLFAGCEEKIGDIRMTSHPDWNISYSKEMKNLFKEYNFYTRTSSRDEGFYDKAFLVNDQPIEENIAWVDFDNNEAVFLIKKTDDLGEQMSMQNPYYLVYDGKRYETMNADHFFILNDQLIYYRCLEQKYDPQLDRNICTHTAIYANDAMMDSMRTDRFHHIEFSFRDSDRVYYSKILQEPHDIFDFDYDRVIRLYSYDGRTYKKELVKEIDSNFYPHGILNGELVLASYGDDSMYVGDKSYGVDTADVKVIDGNLYYIPQEDRDTRLDRGVGEKHYLSLLRNEQKIGWVFSDNDYPEIEDGKKSYCGSFLNHFFTHPLCAYGNYFFAKSQIGYTGINQIYSSERQMEDRDEYFINGKKLNFYPHFDLLYGHNCVPAEGEKEEEFVRGIGFLFDKAKQLQKLLIVAQEGCREFPSKLYVADYLADTGGIGSPILLMEYTGDFFGYTIK